MLVFPSSLFVFPFRCLLSACARWTPPVLAPAPRAPAVRRRFSGLRRMIRASARRLDSWCAGVGDAAIHRPQRRSRRDRHRGHHVRQLERARRQRRHPSLRQATSRKGAHRWAQGRSLRAVAAGGGQDGWRARVRRRRGGRQSHRAQRARCPDRHRCRSARELGLSLIYVPSMRNGKSADDPPEDRGNAILSTLPLSDPIAVELPGERQRRVVIIAKAASVSVAVIHLDASGGWKRLRVFWTPWMRDVQVSPTAAPLPEVRWSLVPISTPGMAATSCAARFLGQLSETTPLSVDRQGLGLRVLDYMFFRAGAGRRARYRQLENRYGSDHRPLVGWVDESRNWQIGGLEDWQNVARGQQHLPIPNRNLPMCSASYQVSVLAQPLARVSIVGARMGDQPPEMTGVIEPPQVHELVNQYVVAHAVGHQHESPIQADVSRRRARSPARPLIPYTDA